MRSFLSAVLLALVVPACAAASQDAVTSDSTALATDALPTGKLERVDPPYTDSYYESITIAPDKHFTIVYLLRSTYTEKGAFLPTTSERRFTYRGDSWEIFTDEGRRVLAFHVLPEDEDHADSYIDFELKSATSTSLELSSVGDWRTFEMRR